MATENDTQCDDVLRSKFCAWLLENGAKFPKIDWPSNNTDSGIRGAVARADIRTGEHMIEIPKHLMMSPPIIFADPEIGEACRTMKDVLHGDLLLTVFIINELRKGPKSFYSPFLRILPEPGNISEWTDEDLKLLQDPALSIRAKGRRRSVEAMYNRSILKIHALFPEIFPLADFTYERFKFSFNSVQARAFGRRLPWTAMVPFADCLNHTNVQTKYDYDVNGNGVFRLFPTGANHYPRGCEVFNSYGRRPNDNLLMDYGFAMLDNEWDEIELTLALPDSDPDFDLRYNALFLVGFSPNRLFRIVHTELPFKALMFLRIALMDARTLQKIVDVVQRPELYIDAAEDVEDTAELESAQVPTEEAASIEGQTSAENAEEAPPSRVKKTVRIAAEAPRLTSPRADALTWFMRVVSASTELKVFSTLRGLMLSMLGAHETSVVQDEAVLQWLTALRLRNRHGADAVTEASEQDDTAGHIGNSDGADDVRSAAQRAGKRGSTDSIPTVEQCTLKLQEVLSASEAERIAGIPLDSDAYWKLVSAVTHRLTRKRILVAIIRRTDQLIAYFENAVRITKGIESVDPVEKASADAPVIPSEDTVQEQVHQQEESCSMLWHSLVGDGDCLYETMAQAQAQQVVDGHRKPSWDYLKRYKRYVWDATNPLQWPEL